MGENLNVEQMLKEVPLEPDRVWKKGEHRFKNNPESRILSISGASFLASNADMAEFETQQKEATDFLKENIALIREMVAFSGVDEATIDFGVELRDVAIHGDYLAPEFIRYAAKAGIGVEISHYPCTDE